MKRCLKLSLILFFLISIGSCGKSDKINQLTDEEKSNGWTLMFDGHSLDGWHLFRLGKKNSVWQVQDGLLECQPKNHQQHGDLVSDSIYEDFDFTFEWRMGEDGNSGVFVNVVENDTLPVAWVSGPEYQILGNANVDFPNPKERSGCIFGLAAQKVPIAVKPVTEWNKSRIKQVKGKLEFYLNDVLSVEVDLHSQAWLDTVANSHFKTYPEFGRHTSGHIVLQDWAKGISFRNLKIKKL